jgi:sugar phosphate isomerase/epimerase
MKPCLSEATTMAATFAEDVAACADAGFVAMEVWLTKLEDHLRGHTSAETKQLLTDRQMSLPAASYQGGLLLSQGQARREHHDQFQRRLALCQEFGIGTLLLAPDFAEAVHPQLLPHAVGALQQACQLAASHDVQLALEFRSSARWCASLDTAANLIAACGEPNLGVALDVFHFYTGPSKLEDFDRIRREQLAFVQLCDVAGVPREFATDADRILPGDGDFALQSLLQRIRQMGYDGYVSVEVLNPELWKVPAAQVADAAFKALRRVL